MAPLQAPDPLASAGLKMVRAQEHLETLGREVSRFKDSRPYQVIHEDDPATGERLIHAVPLRDPDPELSLVLGDLVQNLSAALDHAVFGLSVAEAGRRLSRREEQSVGFPVCTSAPAFEQQARTRCGSCPMARGPWSVPPSHIMASTSWRVSTTLSRCYGRCGTLTSTARCSWSLVNLSCLGSGCAQKSTAGHTASRAHERSSGRSCRD